MAEAIIRNNFGPTEVLELGGIRARFRRKPDQLQCAVQIAIMIGGDISDKVGGVILPPDPVFANFKFHSSSYYAKKSQKLLAQAVFPVLIKSFQAMVYRRQVLV